VPAWKDVILVISVLGAFAFGYFLTKRLDIFLNENREAIEKEKEKKEPSCVVLTEGLSDEELVNEVKLFLDKHEGVRVVLYGSAGTDSPESRPHRTDRKQ